MISFRKKRELRNAVKEALVNLPGGICFFDGNGTLILCNRRMYQLIFQITGRDLQSLGDLGEALRISGGGLVKGRVLCLPDESWWSFSMRGLTDRKGKQYTEVTAFDISDLHEQQELLQEANEAKRQTIETLVRVQDNIVAITREEEILAMKMELHNEFGYHLQAIRHFYDQGCPADAKAGFLEGQRAALEKFRGGLGGSDEIDSFAELVRLAEALDMQITVTGDLPEMAEIRDILAETVRESLTNTIRHAEGRHVFLELEHGERDVLAVITNDGKPPEGRITESGGLASLRKRVESFGGTMTVRSRPEFRLSITLPTGGKDG